MAAGRVRELFADVVSHAALELLNGAGIPVSYTVAVPHIINRAGDGICPVERLCAGARTAAECLPLIEGFLTAGKGGKNRPQPSSASLRRGRPKNKSNTEQ